jgi:hypothetical protein
MARKPKPGPPGANAPVTFETVREIARSLPGAVEGTSYGTPAFRVGKILFVRKHQDGESLVVKMDFDERAVRIRADPETFYITDHYLKYPWVLVRLATVDRDDLEDVITEAWRQCAPDRPVSKPDSGRKRPSRAKSRKPRGG